MRRFAVDRNRVRFAPQSSVHIQQPRRLVYSQFELKVLHSVAPGFDEMRRHADTGKWLAYGA